jgi:HK97 family phage portal protein
MIGDLIRRQERFNTAFSLPPRQPVSQPITGPITVTRATLLSNVVANRCVALISDQLGSLNINVERNGEILETPPLLAAPEVDRTRSEFIAALTTSLLVNGNAYLLAGNRNSLGFVNNVVLLDPEAVQVVVVDGRPQYRTARNVLNPEDVLHIRNFVLPGHVVGYGPLQWNTQSIAQTLAADQYAGEAFMTGAVPDGVLHSENEITSDQAQDLKAAWIAGNGGRQRGPAVLSGGVKYQPLEFSSVDMELLDSRRYNAEQMCTLFGVPSHLVNVPSQDSKTYANVQDDTRFFVTFTLRPLAVKIEEALSTLLPRGQQVKFDFNSVLRGDTQTRYDSYETGLRAGFLTIDEVRALEGLT